MKTLMFVSILSFLSFARAESHCGVIRKVTFKDAAQRIEFIDSKVVEEKNVSPQLVSVVSSAFASKSKICLDLAQGTVSIE